MEDTWAAKRCHVRALRYKGAMRRLLPVALVLLALVVVFVLREQEGADRSRSGGEADAARDAAGSVDGAADVDAELRLADAERDREAAQVPDPAATAEPRTASAIEKTASAEDASASNAPLRGRVVWPDGRGAADALLALEWVDTPARYLTGEPPSTRADADGGFELHFDDALRRRGPMSDLDLEDLRLRAWTTDASGAMHAAALDDPFAEKAEHDPSAVELVLAPVAAVRGRAIRADGGALPAFSARLVSTAGDVPGGWIERTGLAPVHVPLNEAGSTDGAFALPVPSAGSFRLQVDAEGFAQRETLLLTLPADAEREHVVVLERLARLEGVVLDPDGAPCATAFVDLLPGAGEPALGMLFDAESETRETDAAGRFAFDAVAPGALMLGARSRGGDGEVLWAPSERITLDVAPGAVQRDLRLQLQRGGTIEGVVLDDEGGPIEGASLYSMQLDTLTNGHATSDAEGRFRIEHLAPGRYQIQAMADLGAEPDPAAAAREMMVEQADVADGETVFVTFGGVRADAVTVRGRVTLGGEPVRAEIAFAPDAGGGSERRGLAGFAMGRAEEDGEFETRLDRPGDYVLVVTPNGDDFAAHLQPVRVPAVSEFRVDVALPSASIEGRVLRGDGSACGNVAVVAQRSDGLINGAAIDLMTSDVTTDDDGEFEIVGLAAGEYDVVVGGASLFAMFDAAEGDEATPVTRAAVRLAAGERATGVEIVLAEGGRIAGRVVDANGRPVPAAVVWFRDSNGRIVERLSLTSTDAGGRFPGRLLAPGEYTVLARTGGSGDGGLAAPESQPIRVTAGATAQVELVAAPAIALRIACGPEPDAPPLTGTRLRVEDARGRAVEGLTGMEMYRSLYEDGLSVRAPRVGVFPPGRYRCVATSADGRAAEGQIELAAGDGERTLSLELR